MSHSIKSELIPGFLKSLECGTKSNDPPHPCVASLVGAVYSKVHSDYVPPRSHGKRPLVFLSGGLGSLGALWKCMYLDGCTPTVVFCKTFHQPALDYRRRRCVMSVMTHGIGSDGNHLADWNGSEWMPRFVELTLPEGNSRRLGNLVASLCLAVLAILGSECQHRDFVFGPGVLEVPSTLLELKRSGFSIVVPHQHRWETMSVLMEMQALSARARASTIEFDPPKVASSPSLPLQILNVASSCSKLEHKKKNSRFDLFPFKSMCSRCDRCALWYQAWVDSFELVSQHARFMDGDFRLWSNASDLKETRTGSSADEIDNLFAKINVTKKTRKGLANGKKSIDKNATKALDENDSDPEIVTALEDEYDSTQEATDRRSDVEDEEDRSEDEIAVDGSSSSDDMGCDIDDGWDSDQESKGALVDDDEDGGIAELSDDGDSDEDENDLIKKNTKIKKFTVRGKRSTKEDWDSDENVD